MGSPIFMLLVSLLLSLPLSSFSELNILTKGSSLSVEKPDHVLVSPNKKFSAGFYTVGKNAFSFAIWFAEPLHDGSRTIVWMANRDHPVNLTLTDATRITVWASDTVSLSPVQLQLLDTGNLVLRASETVILWQSFDFPTDTLLPNQPLTRNSKLVSSRSQTNYSSGYYKLFFDNDNLLRLLFDGPELVSTFYWPQPWLSSWEAGRTIYNNSRTAIFDSSGHFKSTDKLDFFSTDYGVGVQRRLTVHVDGNIRIHSLDESAKKWKFTWQAISQPCIIHGVCGPNALCTYVPGERFDRRCSCLPGYRARNQTDWSLGCELDFSRSCNGSESGFLQLPNVEFYGYDIISFSNYTLERCERDCLQRCDCYGFQYKYDHGSGYYKCYPKSSLLNGYRSPGFGNSLYLRLPKSSLSSYPSIGEDFILNCSDPISLELSRRYKKPQENGRLQFMVWFACVFGGVEVICIFLIWLLLYRTHDNSSVSPLGYLQVASGFRQFTYDELKKASGNFREVIGRGGGGVVCKGRLSDHRVAAIKRLNDASQGEAEFLAEINTIGRVHHMNLIEIWGYCVEGKHRLLVYEYMKFGSLAENLNSDVLDWEKRFDIAVGSAKGLAYLHEECLEWVLHCDVKPQNILLDSNYRPKVADFGLSKLINRGGGHYSGFSRVRGTRGYMAPEWIFNLPITSKVDVYSYGVVVLEMVTGKSPMVGPHDESRDLGETEQRGLLRWVREKFNGNCSIESRLDEIIGPVMKDGYDVRKMQVLIEVALRCVEEDKSARPTMREVVERLLHHEEVDY
ncbi:putative receptor protein kinase ZmPK1 [Actinidia eriantha]|uniref:putative receptor protein kinase ZmPK1 n=1 Tax=Actinidia eriantha TaxID=165200 RepID=UPI00258BE0CC|nr:putative receptor protein kinase ZmPK1 [Actinidia eriantha]